MNNAAPIPPPSAKGQPHSSEKNFHIHKTWYYGAISRAQCDDLLNSRGHDGDFLIRDSETNVSANQFYYRTTFLVHIIENEEKTCKELDIGLKFL